MSDLRLKGGRIFRDGYFCTLGHTRYRDITKKDCQIKEVIVVASYSFEK